jgi:hypothetical protein
VHSGSIQEVKGTLYGQREKKSLLSDRKMSGKSEITKEKKGSEDQTKDK